MALFLKGIKGVAPRAAIADEKAPTPLQPGPFLSTKLGDNLKDPSITYRV